MAKKKKFRRATLYDAVEGRIGTDGFINPNAKPPEHSEKTHKGQKPLTTEEVIYRNPRIPLPVQEYDTYGAHTRLGPHQRLPESDLLKAIHKYTSDLYSTIVTRKQKNTWRSNDETALIAMGILLEESCSQILGETGDMVFTEAHDYQVGAAPRKWNGETWVDSVIEHRNPAKPDPEKRQRSVRNHEQRSKSEPVRITQNRGKNRAGTKGGTFGKAKAGPTSQIPSTMSKTKTDLKQKRKPSRSKSQPVATSSTKGVKRKRSVTDDV